MPAKTKKLDASTEEKIKSAAKKVFQEKGYAASRTRDIAEEAGINLALLNYYFRSKQKLFELIMMETLQGFIQSMSTVFNDPNSTLENKINVFSNNYIDFLLREPGIPLFILSEIKANPYHIVQNVKMKEILMDSYFRKQFEKAIQEKKLPQQNIMHFLMNLIALTVFPFVASPLLKALGGFDDQAFNQLMLERKSLIPKWIQTLMKAS